MNNRIVNVVRNISTIDPRNTEELVQDFCAFFADIKTVERHVFTNPDSTVVEYRTPDRKNSWSVVTSKKSSIKVLSDAEVKIRVFLLTKKLEIGYRPSGDDFLKLSRDLLGKPQG